MPEFLFHFSFYSKLCCLCLQWPKTDGPGSPGPGSHRRSGQEQEIWSTGLKDVYKIKCLWCTWFSIKLALCVSVCVCMCMDLGAEDVVIRMFGNVTVQSLFNTVIWCQIKLRLDGAVSNKGTVEPTYWHAHHNTVATLLQEVQVAQSWMVSNGGYSGPVRTSYVAFQAHPENAY